MSKFKLLNVILSIDILTSTFAPLTSEIVMNLNKLNTLLPLSSDTTKGDDGVCHLSKYQPIELGSPL